MRFGNACGEGPKIKTLQKSLYWVLEYVRRVPDIRREKVKEMRHRVSSGSWNPKSTRIAEKILSEHLFDPKTS
jgi:anti-sigma28 factor (negative regulator of flagellin synthesis)